MPKNKADDGTFNGDWQLAFHLCQGMTIEEAAKKNGISKRTVYRRKDDPEFQRVMRSVRGAMIGRIVSKAVAYADRAVDTIAKITFDDQQVLPGVAAINQSRLSGAYKLIDIAMKGSEQIDLTEKVSELIDRAEKQNDAQNLAK